MSALAGLREPRHERLRIGFLGLGWIGRKRLDALAACEDIEVAAIGDVDPVCLQVARLDYPRALCAVDIESMYDVDAMVLATPNGLHARQAIACLERGLPVFCQKPLATSLTDTERVIATARRANRLLGVDLCYRHVSGMERLRREIAAGRLGEIVAIDLKFHNAYGPDKTWSRNRQLAGGGCLLDLGVHLLDLALWLQNNPPLERVRSRLFARGEPVAPGDGAIEDLAVAELIQRNGAVVRLSCSWHAHIGVDALIEASILGTQAGAIWRNVGGSFHDFTLDLVTGASYERIGSYPDDWGVRTLRNWVGRLRRDPGFDPEIEHVARSAALIEEIYRA